MQGNRLTFERDKPFAFKPGDYGQDAEGVWWIRPPRGGLGRLDNHTVVEHEDGTITVSPSILQSGSWDSEPATQWHGYLEHGVWREC